MIEAKITAAETQTKNIPKGRPKSGRIWKNRERKRFSSMKQGKPFNTSWEDKMKLKNEIKNVKEQEKAMKAGRKQLLEDARKRREENQRRRVENQKKAEIVQVIKNTAKLRRMSKKQMKTIEKR